MKGAARIKLFILFFSISGFSSFGQSRTETFLPDNWKFIYVKSGEFADKAPPEGAGWMNVNIPHSYGTENWSLKDYIRCPAWYRRIVKIPDNIKKRRLFLKFQAVSSVAQVFLNGERLGEHRGAFGAFVFEITNFVHPDADNLLELRVSNEKFTDIAPLAGDFCVPGGIYRPVSLIETDEICFTPLDHGSSGLTILQTKIGADEAVLDIAGQVSFLAKKNDGLTERPQMPIIMAFTNPNAKNNARRLLSISLIDATGRVVAQNNSEIIIQPYVTPEYRRRLVVKNPHLWNGRIDPYLYKVVAILKNNDTETDRVEHSVGLRSIAVDPEKGFLLNGKVLRLRGVNRHQDRMGSWAITARDEQEDISMILDMGANAVRAAHYQHSENFYSLCDKAGVLVWAELPLVSELGKGESFATTSRNQLLDLIRQNMNHPSIFAWSLFNELTPPTQDAHRILSDLNKLAHSEDPSRPTIAASSNNWWPEMNSITDWLGFNTYPFWYSGNDPGKMYDDRRYIPRIPAFCIGEYGAGASVNQHKNITGIEDWSIPKSFWHPEEWQTYCHKRIWAAIVKRPYVWGSFAWVMFDFVSWNRNEGDQPRVNDKGIVTGDRKVKKDIYYFYKSNWSEEPVAYIASRRYVKRGNALTPVEVFSNAEEVELKVNGRIIGTLKPDSLRCANWSGIKLSRGNNSIKITARFSNGQKLTDSCIWEYIPGYKEDYVGKGGFVWEEKETNALN